MKKHIQAHEVFKRLDAATKIRQQNSNRNTRLITLGSNATGLRRHEHTHTKDGVDPIDSILDEGAIALTTRGDLVYMSATDLARLAIGTNKYVLTSDGTDPAWADPAHAMLDGDVHSDSVADGVTRGSIIYGNATPKWDELVIGAGGTVLYSDGTDVAWVDVFENPPTEDEANKAPSSEWAFDHDANVNAHHAQAHKDTHDPSGNDPIDTAAPDTNITPEQANAEGDAETFARSDHMHYIPSGAPSELASVQAAAEGTGAAFARTDHAHQIQHSIADNHIVTMDDAGPAASGEYARFTANGLEGVAGKLYVPLASALEIYASATVSAEPRTKALSANAAGTALTFAAGAGEFFEAGMNGNAYAYIQNTTKTEFAWITDITGDTGLTVTDSGDISGWQTGDTISTNTINAGYYLLDVTQQTPSGCRAIYAQVRVMDSNVTTQWQGATVREGAGLTELGIWCPASTRFATAYQIIPIDANRRFEIRHNPSGANTMSYTIYILGYFI